jgi:hypothetical protein
MKKSFASPLKPNPLQHLVSCQESRLLWLSEGDAPTKFFHNHANSRHQKKKLCCIEHDGQTLFTEERKAEAFYTYFDDIQGSSVVMSHGLHLHLLDLPRLDAPCLTPHFSEDEVWSMIRALPPDKAPRLDGFTTLFLQIAWLIIQADFMRAFDAFWHMDTRNFHSVNDAFMTLIPKSTEVVIVVVKDFHPISLIHIVGKLFSKVLVVRLAPNLATLVHLNQSAFNKGRVIHDNLKFVQSSSKILHARRLPTLLLKVDIVCAFNSVAWLFLLEVLQHLGFPRAWCDWISMLLSMTSTRVLLNGSPGHHICHVRGL